VLSDFQVSIPELGTLRASTQPLVLLTSNNTRELSEALKRRCLFLHITYPDIDREKEIVLSRVEGVTDELADRIARVVHSVREVELKKPPSVSETLDWARPLLELGIDNVDQDVMASTMHVLLKYQTDIDRATAEFTD